MVVLFLLLQLLHIGAATSPTTTASIAQPGCQETCGNITVPFPFGIGPSRCHIPGFEMTCNETYYPPVLYTQSGLPVSSIFPDHALMYSWTARNCYDETNSPSHAWTDLKATPFTFSHTRNRFTTVGCDAVALISFENSTGYTSGCMSLCRDVRSVTNGSCAGIGCCETAIPEGMKRFDLQVDTLFAHSRTANFSPCSFAFVSDGEEYEFLVEDFVTLRSRTRMPMVLDWAVGNLTCDEATRSTGSLLCGVNSHCLDAANGKGYQCSCNKGYTGNPYLPNGCKDINECEDPNKPCVDICTNTPGSFTCSCSPDATGDGRRAGTGCTQPSKAFPLVKVVLGSGLGFLFLLITASLLYWTVKKRRLILLRDKLFKQNGGLLLQQRISSHDGATETLRIFTSEELVKATDNYSPSRIIGRGGNGTVYKGILPDNRVVAIKKSMLVDTTQIEQFINEVVILSQVIHRNLVKILGCCLETQVPLLVYEYVSNNTLAYHLYGSGQYSSLSWESRLRIAVETAGALAYLHSATLRSIIHRDVKSTNILLDENYKAKVADFGASRWVPLNRAHLTTMVQGTLGYLDPEYFQTGQLTERSDVYSFGVVLVELLTGERPISSQRSDEERSLAMYFILSRERNRLFDIIEPRVVREGEQAQIEEVADIAERCLRVTSEERPSMREVAEELERAQRLRMHPWVGEEDDEDNEESRLLVGSPSIPVPNWNGNLPVTL